MNNMPELIIPVVPEGRETPSQEMIKIFEYADMYYYEVNNKDYPIFRSLQFFWQQYTNERCDQVVKTEVRDGDLPGTAKVSFVSYESLTNSNAPQYLEEVYEGSDICREACAILHDFFCDEIILEIDVPSFFHAVDWLRSLNVRYPSNTRNVGVEFFSTLDKHSSPAIRGIAFTPIAGTATTRAWRDFELLSPVLFLDSEGILRLSITIAYEELYHNMQIYLTRVVLSEELLNFLRSRYIPLATGADF